ncbi:hypothetical protein ACHQM5_012157 [Ranunculus cassubicifolius]
MYLRGKGSMASSSMDMVEAYTGLSPTAFFTILALMFGVYKFVCALFVDDDPSNKKPSSSTIVVEEKAAATVQVEATEEKAVSDLSWEDLRAYDGSDPAKPLLMAIKSQIYDVSPSRMFYGPGGPYALFAGRDASRALALMSFDPDDLTGDLDGLEPSELEVLQDWEYKFQEKYKRVGQIVTPSRNEQASPEESGREKQL